MIRRDRVHTAEVEPFLARSLLHSDLRPIFADMAAAVSASGRTMRVCEAGHGEDMGFCHGKLDSRASSVAGISRWFRGPIALRSITP